MSLWENYNSNIYFIVEIENVLFDGRVGVHIVGRITDGTATGRVET